MTRRASRMLMGVLSVTTVVGLGAYALTHRDHSPSTTKTEASKPGTGLTILAAATESPAKPPGAKPEAKPLDPKVAVSVTPTTAPSAIKASVTIPPISTPPQPTASLATAIPDGKAKIDSGELLAGRKILSEALASGTLNAADTATAKQLIAKANETIVFSPRRFNDDSWGGTHPVANGEVLQKIAFKYGVTPELLLRINGMSDARKLRAGASIKVLQGPLHAVVSKKAFTLDIYFGSPGEKGAQYVTTYGVGLGKDDSTPPGTWMVESRIPNPKWWGARGLPPIEAGDPKNPLGKYWIALTGVDGKAEGQQSYGIHGTIEPDSIGKQASMGCIRMRNEDVALVYELLVAGKSTVVVKE